MIIEILEALPDEPPFFMAIASEETKSQKDVVHGYAADVEPELAQLRAKWECCERMTLMQYTESSKTQCIEATPSHLGSKAISIYNYAGMPNENFGEFVKTDYETTREWVEVSNYSNSQVKYAPIETVALRLPCKPAKPIREPLTTGVAAHSTQLACDNAAILEIIERDAFMRAQLGVTDPSCLMIDSDTQELINHLRQYRLCCKIYSLPAIADVTVILAIIIDRSGFGPALTAGLSAGYNAVELSKKAILEAWQPRCWLRRAYYKSQLTRETNKICTALDRGLYWWPLHRLKDIDRLISTKETLSYNDVSITEMSVTQLADNIVKSGHQIYRVSLEIEKKKGVSICRMLIPTLYPLYLNEQYKYTNNIVNTLFPPVHFFL